MGKPRHIAPEIIKLREEGKTYDQIKAVLNCSKATISYHVGKDSSEKNRAKKQIPRKKINNFIQHYKSANPCVDCGHKFNYYSMQFDHLPQYTKKFTIAKWYDHTFDIKEVMAEMKKCDLVCGNCHTERSHKRRLESNETKQRVSQLLESGLEEEDIV
jgi:arsenate reductase-like glutaredoxin family protein